MARTRGFDIGDIINSPWLGGAGNRPTASGPGAAFTAGTRVATQRAISSTVKGAATIPPAMVSLGAGTSYQTAQDLMYNRPGSGRQAIKEAAASAAIGYAAGRVVGGVASTIAKARLSKSAELAALKAAQQEIVPTNLNNLMHHGSASHLLSSGYNPVHMRSSEAASWMNAADRNIHMGSPGASFDRIIRSGSGRGATIDRYEIVDPSSVATHFEGMEIVDNAGERYRNRLRGEGEMLRSVQKWDFTPTPNNQILSYLNEAEDIGSRSYLVPRTQVKGAQSASTTPAAVYRGSVELPPIDSRTVKRGEDYVTSYEIGSQVFSPSEIPNMLLNLKYTSPQILESTAALEKKRRALDTAVRRATAQASALGYVAPRVAVNTRNNRGKRR